MSTKKKTTAKKTTKQVKAHLAAKFDDALELPAAKSVVAVEPMEVTAEDALDETAAEDWPNYSPFHEEETEGSGFSPAKEQPAWMPTAEELDVMTDGPNVPVPMDEPVLGSGSPVDASDPISGTGIPSDASKTVRDLLDGLNYLWKMAQTIRGPRGPKMHDESILKKRVAKARELEKLLAGLK